MWDKIKSRHKDIGFVSAIVVILYGLYILIYNSEQVKLFTVLVFILYTSWILYSLNKENYFTRNKL